MELNAEARAGEETNGLQEFLTSKKIFPSLHFSQYDLGQLEESVLAFSTQNEILALWKRLGEARGEAPNTVEQNSLG